MAMPREEDVTDVTDVSGRQGSDRETRIISQKQVKTKELQAGPTEGHNARVPSPFPR